MYVRLSIKFNLKWLLGSIVLILQNDISVTLKTCMCFN